MKMFFLGLTILEPITFLTDLVLAVTAFIIQLTLKKQTIISKAVLYWHRFFLLLAVSTLFGGFAHALANYTGKILHLFSWVVSGVAILAVELSAIDSFKKLKTQFHIFVFLKFILFFIFLLWKQNFVVVKINSMIGLGGIVFIFHLKNSLKKSNYRGSLIVAGILLLSSSAVVHGLKLSFSEYLNHNDLSHLIMALSLVVIFRGVKRVYKVENRSS